MGVVRLKENHAAKTDWSRLIAVTKSKDLPTPCNVCESEQKQLIGRPYRTNILIFHLNEYTVLYPCTHVRNHANPRSETKKK